MPASYRDVEGWTAKNVDALPSSETDQYEFKSAKISMSALGDEIDRAGSAFWNSGGGFFVAGVGGDGVPDGGIQCLVGKQPLRDWVDQAVMRVTPRGPYAVGVVTSCARGHLRTDHGILVIAFGDGPETPYMASDYKHYARAGAHTVPLGSHLVEALRTHRGFTEPRLEALLRYVSMTGRTAIAVELMVVAVNDSPALDVRMDIKPAPEIQNVGVERKAFPKRVPLIRADLPFVVRIAAATNFHGCGFDLVLTYRDLTGRELSETKRVSAADQLGPALY